MEELQTLITEKAKDVSVELSSLFEGLDLTDELKENLQISFDTAVKTTSVQLVENVLSEREAQLEEKHIQEMLDMTESMEKQHQEKLDTLVESTQTYIDDFLTEWVEKNKITIDNQIKAKLFDSIFESLTNVFVEHNLNVPTEEVHVMDELQEEVQELQSKVDSLLKERKQLQTELQESKIKDTIKRLTENLTDSQKEKVIALSESIVVDDKVEQKLKTIIAMVEATEKAQKEKDEDDEKGSEEKTEDKEPEKIDESAGLNYIDPNAQGKPENTVNPTIAKYLRYV